MILVKEDLKYIASYLPYDLQYCIEKHWPNYNDKNVNLTVNGYSIDAEECLNFKFLHKLEKSNLLYFSNELPIGGIVLRPKEDLIKEIKTNGVKIIPIFELFKIAINFDEYDDKELESADEAFEFYFEDDLYHLKLDAMIFTFDNLDNSFSLFLNDECMPVQNQDALFQKLYELKIDIHNLIAKQKALDINKIMS